MHLIDGDKLLENIALAVEDAPAHIQAAVYQHITEAPTVESPANGTLDKSKWLAHPVKKSRPSKYELYTPYTSTFGDRISNDGETLYKKAVKADESATANYCSACGKRLCSRFENFCPSCGRPLTEEAFAELEKRMAEQHKNEPLTLNELRKMKKEPVWIQLESPEWAKKGGYNTDGGFWDILKNITESGACCFYESELSEQDYGKTWLAYKEEEV